MALVKVMSFGLIFLLTCVNALTATAAPSEASAGHIGKPFDFDGDGYADLAVGVPGEHTDCALDRCFSGAVQVLYGSTQGITPSRDQFWMEASAGLRAVDHGTWGYQTASGDFDGDGFADLAIVCISFTDWGITTLYGGRGGLTSRNQWLGLRSSIGSPNGSVTLAVGDFEGDGISDLVVGTPGASVGEVSNAGALTILSGSGSGLSLVRSQRIDRATPGVVGGVEPSSSFGLALATGDLDGDQVDDLAVGMIGASSGTRDVPGNGVNVFLGSAGGLQVTGSRLFGPRTPGVSPPGTALTDLFGRSVVIGDFDGDGYGDLAIAAFGSLLPGVCVSPCAPGGVVVILPGSPTGPSAEGRQIWSQDSPGVPGQAEADDAFGAALATGDLNGDHRDDLAIAAPHESVGSVTDAGGVNVLYGSASGLNNRNAQQWTQDAPGIKGTAEAGDSFGSALRILNFGRSNHADLAISTTNEAIDNTDWAAGAVSILYGSPTGASTTDQFWHQNRPGVKGVAERGDSFGAMERNALFS